MILKNLKCFLIKLISSVFFIGYLPLIPGTFGSLVGVFLFYLLQGAGWISYLLTILCVLILGLKASGAMEDLLGKKDPGCIVIDEVAGMLLALSFMPPDFKIVILAFLIFRILDTLKPFPAGRLQNWRGSIGVMADDLIAGFYTNLVLQVILRIL